MHVIEQEIVRLALCWLTTQRLRIKLWAPVRPALQKQICRNRLKPTNADNKNTSDARAIRVLSFVELPLPETKKKGQVTMLALNAKQLRPKSRCCSNPAAMHQPIYTAAFSPFAFPAQAEPE
jgi:hypothetical protein